MNRCYKTSISHEVPGLAHLSGRCVAVVPWNPVEGAICRKFVVGGTIKMMKHTDVPYIC